MASITYDGQSFMLDGRRVWLVSGSICSARVPRELWSDRIHAARLAGLNTIETPVVWSRHEQRPGQFDFTGDNDIRHFVELVAQAGMYCILRPGPYIGQGFDLGGMPPWLLSVEGMNLRSSAQPFLEACSRYITAVSQQVRDLQVTSPGTGGPIILVQNESGWTCGDDELAQAYLGELNRYYRESGITVPIINANDLWQGVEGEIDCWTGYESMLAYLRQLGTVRAEKPRLVVEFRAGVDHYWGREAPEAHRPGAVMRRLAEILAVGAQFNIDPFHGGTNFGFLSGRDAGVDAFRATSNDRGAPLTETGVASPSFAAVRRVCTFASRFGRTLANLDPRRWHVTVHPGAAEAATEHGQQPGGAQGGTQSAPSIVHASGSQGSVVFIFTDEHRGKSKSPHLPLLLPDGSTLPVFLGSQPVTWLLLGARLNARAQLDYSNLTPFAMLGSVLVCYGPAGTPGVLSINHSQLEVEVPDGKTPSVVEHEGMTVVVASEQQIDTVFVSDDAVFLGVAGLTKSGEPVQIPGSRQYTRISASGQVKAGRFPATRRGSSGDAKHSPRSSAQRDRVPLKDWAGAPATDYVEGTSERYAAIDGPADLAQLGSPYGYGWYRLRFSSPSSKKIRLMFPGSADRLLLHLDGSAHAVAGRGPGAAPEVAFSTRKREQTLVVLAENFGRPTAGVHMAAPTGLCGHGWAVSPVRLGKPKLETAEPLRPLGYRSPLWHVHHDDATDPERLTWQVMHRRKTPLLLTIGPMPCRGLILVNGQVADYFEPGNPRTLLLDPETLSRGKNILQAAVLDVAQEYAQAIAQSVSLHEAVDCVTGRAEWAFAKWESPPPDAFLPAEKTVKSGTGVPTWWRCTFTPDETDLPILLDLSGMTKGQIYVNDRHVGRYFVGDSAGKPVPPQTRYHIPRPWVEHGAPNELVLFDEHGAGPASTALVIDPAATPFDA